MNSINTPIYIYIYIKYIKCYIYIHTYIIFALFFFADDIYIDRAYLIQCMRQADNVEGFGNLSLPQIFHRE